MLFNSINSVDVYTQVGLFKSAFWGRREYLYTFPVFIFPGVGDEDDLEIENSCTRWAV